jgi:PhnB protein
MTRGVNPIPEKYKAATPYLRIKGAAAAIDFYKQAFGAVETERIMMPDGRVGHAEMKIGDALFMLSEEFAEMGILGPQSLGGTSVGTLVYVVDVDAVVSHAVACGATLNRPVADQFYGDRSGQVLDPFGHLWMIATHIEDVPSDEMRKRAAALFGAPNAAAE